MTQPNSPSSKPLQTRQPLAPAAKAAYVKMAQTLHSQASKVVEALMKKQGQPNSGLTTMERLTFEKAFVGDAVLSYSTRAKGAMMAAAESVNADGTPSVITEQQAAEAEQLYSVGMAEIVTEVMQMLPCDELPSVKVTRHPDGPAGTLLVKLGW
jgi:hypothetical protein